MRGGRILGLALLALAGAVPAQGQVRVDRPTGELSVEFDGSQFDFPERSGDRIRTFREWLLFRTRISAVHPNVARLDVALRPLFTQTSWTGPVESPNGGIEQLDGKLGLHLFSAQPASAHVQAYRISGDNKGRYGARVDTDIAEWSAWSDLKLKGLPSKLEYIDHERDVFHLQPSGNAFQEDQRIRTLRFQSRNSKMGLTLERLDFDDRIGTASYEHTRANFDHRFSWGKGSSLSSQFQYLDRTGAGAVDRVNWQQIFRLQHTWKLYSDGFYTLFDQSTPGDFSRGWSAQYMPGYDVNPRLRFAVEGWGQARDFRVGSQSYYRVRPRAYVNVPVSGGVRFSADAGAGYEWHDQQTSEEEGTGAVVGERHVVDDFGRFTLREPLVIASSVVIRSPNGTVLYEQDFDYRLVPAGPFLDVVALPTGRLDPGVEVVADYQYEILPGGSANAVISDWNLGLTAGPASVYFRGRRQDEVGGDPGEITLIPTLRDYNDSALGLRLSTQTPAGNLSLNGEWARSSARTYDFTSYLVGGSLGFPIGRRFTGTIVGRYTARRGGELPYDLAQGEGILTWIPVPYLRIVGRVGAYKWTEGDLSGEQFVGGGVGAEWRIHRLLLAARYDYLDYSEGFVRTENRFMIRISRAF